MFGLVSSVGGRPLLWARPGGPLSPVPLPPSGLAMPPVWSKVVGCYQFGRCFLELQSVLLSSPLFHDSVSSLRASCLSRVAYDRPFEKRSSVFDQKSPLGHTRIVADAQSIEEHIERALRVHSLPSRVWDSVPRDLAASVQYVAACESVPGLLLQRRAEVQQSIARVAEALRVGLLPAVRRLAPAHVCGLPTVINVPFVAALCAAMEWPDTLLPAKLLFGSPVCGPLPSSNVLRPKERSAWVDASTFDSRAWTDELERRVRRRGRRNTRVADALDAAVLSKSIAETQPVSINGVATEHSWADGPFTREQMDVLFPGGYWPSRRFGVAQRGEVRPCDDFSESQMNGTVSSDETVASDGADFPAWMAELFYSLGVRSSIRGGCDDWKKAYRQLPVWDPSHSVVAQWDPVARRVVYFVVKGHCFGAYSAVNSFNAVSKFLTYAARCLFAAVCGNYYDDHVVVEPAFAGCSAQEALLALAAACGFVFDVADAPVGKHVSMRPLFVYLGIRHDLSRCGEGLVFLRIVEARRVALVTDLRNILKRGSLSPGAASSLRGKLYFAVTTAYGRVGRAALQPILQRQEGRDVGHRLSPALIVALKFFVTLLNYMPDREIRFDRSAMRPLLVWSDASWEGGVGHLGFVAFDPERLPYDPCDPDSGQWLYSESPVPSHILDMFVAKRQKIGQYEIAAAFMVYPSLAGAFPSSISRRRVVHWIDNTSAISCLLNGYSGKPDSALLVNAFHLFNARDSVRAHVHFEYVESAANVADLPSRLDLRFVRDVLRARFVPPTLLDECTWRGPLRGFLAGDASRARGKRGRRGGASGWARDARDAAVP